MENMIAKMMAQYPDGKKMWEMIEQIRARTRMQNTQTTSDKVEYECSLCEDKKGLSRVDHEGRRRWRDCDCVLREVSLRRIEKSGLAYAIDSCTFDNYISIENWQRDVKSKAMEFAENDAPLFFAGGQVGSGKTHICTAIAGELLKTKLSYWFPIIQKAGLPVPRTEIVQASKEDTNLLWEAMEKDVSLEDMKLTKDIAEAGRKIGEPFFLRTDHFSGKHYWKGNCFVQSVGKVAQHIYNIHEMWHYVSFGEVKTWAVREMLPTIPQGICERYGDMPVCKEFRIFVEDDKILCIHPYWPLEALIQGGAKYYAPDFCYEKFCDPGDDLEHLKELAIKAGKALSGAWSVDLLETEKGWYLTDMAEAGVSWHWKGCKNALHREEVKKNKVAVLESEIIDRI